MFMPLKQQDEFGFGAGAATGREGVNQPRGKAAIKPQARFEQMRK
ncbi:hypothetical protein M529_21590 [Sphingobium ummariense RL-3]|uniref:Uncharacterized protein n=1 Tax=Sphingobium ummariense RL-3 TaxID=1346791 RepID=T0IMJ7_9SPHN|nr:hypothetical protein M529_21590 [Sphingobium ummariense RL-3]